MTARGRSARAFAAGLAPVAIALAAAAAPAGAIPTDTPTVVAQGLSTPWAVEAPWQERVFVTERSARASNPNAAVPPRIRVLQDGGGVAPEPVFVDTSAGVAPRKFLGLALHPSFRANGLAYLYETYTRDGVTRSRILRLKDDCTRFTLDRVIFDGIGSDLNHDGGRIAFGPDGKLYATTGDVHDPARPRNRQSLNGKILRLEAPGTDADGTAPADNPYVGEGGNAQYVWSYGHRHPQGLAWDAAGRLWETEHGPSGEGHAPAGATNGRDELNLIEKGGDYGWPAVAGDQTLEGTIAPTWHSGPAPAAAPGGLAFAEGVLYMPMLNGAGLRTFTVATDGSATPTGVLYDDEYGRMRAATIGTDGMLWLTTDDGRVLRVRAASPALPPVVLPACGHPQVEPVVPGPDQPGAPAPTATTPAPQSTQPPQGSAPAAGLPTQLVSTTTTRASVAGRLLSRGTTAAEGLGIRGLLRRGAFTVRVGGLGTDRAVVRLLRGSTTLARGAAAPGSRSTVAVRVRLTEAGRRYLRRRSSARLTLRTDVLAKGARSGSVRRAQVTLKR